MDAVFTGTQVRTRQSPLFDTYNIATTTAFPALVKMFGSVEGTLTAAGAVIGPELTNMQKPFELAGGCRHLVGSMRVVITGGAADIANFNKNYTVRFFAGGIRQLDAPAEFWPGGAGVSGSASNGLNDPRAINTLESDPVQLEDGINFRVDLVGTTFTTAAAMQIRVYLDGRYTEPV